MSNELVCENGGYFKSISYHDYHNLSCVNLKLLIIFTITYYYLLTTYWEYDQDELHFLVAKLVCQTDWTTRNPYVCVIQSIKQQSSSSSASPWNVTDFLRPLKYRRSMERWDLPTRCVVWFVLCTSIVNQWYSWFNQSNSAIELNAAKDCNTDFFDAMHIW